MKNLHASDMHKRNMLSSFKILKILNVFKQQQQQQQLTFPTMNGEGMKTLIV